MKKLVITFILCIPFLGMSQDITDWQVGINLNPFIFNRINGHQYLEKDKQDFPNGFGYGLTIEKNWNYHWGIKTGFESSRQNQKYSFSYTIGADGSHFNLNDIKINADFTYYKIPVTIQYHYLIKEKLYLTFNQGFQYSMLNNYKVIEIRHNSTLGNAPWRTRENEEGLFKKDLLGLIGSIGIKGFLSEKISYTTNIRYEFDLTKSDHNTISVEYWDAFESNIQTQNFRVGLELGLQYHFEELYIFKKH